MEWQDQIKQFVRSLDSRVNKIGVIVGAGASVASGLHTFRGKDGLYAGKRPEELASPHGFIKDPDLVWEWYQMRMRDVYNAKPNAIHHALVKLEQLGILDAVITQNVDGLHRAAGQSEKFLIEIHGTIRRSHCFENCGKSVSWDEPPSKVPVYCECGSYQRPSVVWFGEALNLDNFDRIDDILRRVDLLLLIGTSGYVMPVASFPSVAKHYGAKIVDFNVQTTLYDSISDLYIEAPAEQSVPIFVEILHEFNQYIH